MTLKPNEVVIIDGAEFVVVTYYQNTDNYLLKENGAPPILSRTIFRSNGELQGLLTQGRLVLGSTSCMKGGNPSCLHSWKRYLGAVPASCFDFCTRCDAKKEVRFMEGEK